MDAADLIAKVLARREQWVDLEPGKRVKLRRPPEAEIPALRAATPEMMARHCVDWDGFTEADLLGAEIASDTKVKFNVDLWVTVAMDRLDWLEKVARTLTDAVMDFMKKRDDAAKN